jgi:antitoxin component YwqK of YwqJK toxin-antitoxin module
MKQYFHVMIFLLGLFSVAQTDKSPKLEVRGDMILATYFHDNGVIHQQGFFSKDGTLNGLWTSYDTLGNKVSQGYYLNGMKTGQWLFWIDNTLKEVDFADSKIINVYEWRQKSNLASNIK